MFNTMSSISHFYNIEIKSERKRSEERNAPALEVITKTFVIVYWLFEASN